MLLPASSSLGCPSRRRTARYLLKDMVKSQLATLVLPTVPVGRRHLPLSSALDPVLLLLELLLPGFAPSLALLPPRDPTALLSLESVLKLVVLRFPDRLLVLVHPQLVLPPVVVHRLEPLRDPTRRSWKARG